MTLNDKLLLRLTEEMKADLAALAVKMDRPVSWLIRHAIEEMLKEAARGE